MEEVIGFKDSPYAGGTMEHLPLDKMSIVLAEGKEPGMTGAVEFTSPIGTKIVFRKYRKGESLFMDAHIVYASVSQLRETCPISIQNPPVILPIDFEGLSRNMDGYYRLEDIMGRFDNTITEFENLAILL